MVFNVSLFVFVLFLMCFKTNHVQNNKSTTPCWVFSH